MAIVSEEYGLTDDEIEHVWFGSWPNDVNKRDVIYDTLLKYSGAYASGYTVMQICKSLGLIYKNSLSTRVPRLTKRGKRVMYWMTRERLNNG